MARTRPLKVCKVCGEYKEHRAHGMCHQCYSRGRKGKRLKKTCIICGEFKEHGAHGMCRSCYKKERRVKKPLNPNSTTYLGCTIAEKVLSRVFKDVTVMKVGNPGFDFFCNKGKKIDVKSACMRKNRWLFHIKRNTTADFFLCIAFDDRESLTPLHLWLIPLSEVRDKVSASISETTIHKWDKFKLDISETLQCCDEMKEKGDFK